jgi:predicted nuclease of predicted toxin-antitoxin system
VRVLLDEQLSESLLHQLRDLWPDGAHVRQLGLGGAADDVVWQRAIELGCVLVTKDEDFHRLSVLKGAPPKVVWIRLGNCSTDDIRDSCGVIRPASILSSTIPWLHCWNWAKERRAHDAPRHDTRGLQMQRIDVTVSDGLLAALGLSAEEVAEEMRVAAAVHWYQQGTISMARAGERPA